MTGTLTTRHRWSRGSSKKIPWYCSARTHSHFRALLESYQEAESEGDVDRAQVIIDDIRHLPNFPRGYDVEHDIIEPVVTTVRR